MAAIGTTTRFVWHDLLTPDVEASRRFYGELLGWDYDAWETPGGAYTLIVAAGRQRGGMMQPDPAQGTPPQWVGYVAVVDVDAAVERVGAAGGSVRVPGTDIPEVGRFAMVADPQGASFALFTGSGEPPPEEEGRPPAGAFAWHELLTSDVEAAKAFYGDVLGWTTEPFPLGADAPYELWHHGETNIGGLYPKPDDAPVMWVLYVSVEDTDATVERAQQLGAKLVAPPAEVPEVGRWAVLVDPAGAAFAVLGPNTGS